MLESLYSKRDYLNIVLNLTRKLRLITSSLIFYETIIIIERFYRKNQKLIEDIHMFKY